MVDSLFSESWYRVADLKPRIRSHAQIHRHTYRGRDWYVLEDHASGRFHRFSEEAYFIIGLMDGKRSLQEIWEGACDRLGDDMPTQEEVIRLLFQLYQVDVLQTDMPPDIADLHQRYRKQKRNILIGQLASPFAIRFPLFDPERFLSATHFLVRPLYSWWGGFLWCAFVLSALLLAVMHWDALTSNLADRVLATQNLVLLWLAYPIIKGLHEFGHAYTVKQWGGEVHEMGIMLLVFVPIPYVDASASSAFWDKRKRVLVDGAGILTEAFLASVAMWVWVSVEPGAIRALAFNVMIIAGVSTLLFNGNPLLRFDAYYILADYLEIPNLGLRSNRYLGYLGQRYLLGIREAQNPVSADGESKWLAFYGVASFVYRMFIMIRIAMFVAGKFFFFGVVLAFWGFFSMFIMPLFKVLRYVFTDTAAQKNRNRVLAVVVGSMVLILLLLAVIPIPSYTVAEGVLWAPDNSRVYARSDGFVHQVSAVPGTLVRKGDVLIVCMNEELDTEVGFLAAQLSEYETRYTLGLTRDRTEADILFDEIERIQGELQRKQSEKDDLVIRSEQDGVFLLPNPEDFPGRWVRRGTPLGYVIDVSTVTAHIVVAQRDVDRVRSGTKRLAARLAGSIDKEYTARIWREVPAASSELPSLALSLEGGGALALDPRENEVPKAFEKLFQFEIQIDGSLQKRIGERVFVRFEHDPEPIAFRVYRNIRRTLLRKFSV